MVFAPAAETPAKSKTASASASSSTHVNFAVSSSLGGSQSRGSEGEKTHVCVVDGSRPVAVDAALAALLPSPVLALAVKLDVRSISSCVRVCVPIVREPCRLTPL